MKSFLIVISLALVSSLFCSCGTTVRRVDPQGNRTLTTAHDINVKDWQIAAEKCINSLLESGVLIRPDGRKYVVMISHIKNSTIQRINTNILTDKIRQAMLKSGKAVITTAVASGGPEDKATAESRKLQDSTLFDQRTVQQDGTAIAPDLSLGGEIIQQKTKGDDIQESYFFFHMTLTDLKTGLAIWEDNAEVVKQVE